MNLTFLVKCHPTNFDEDLSKRLAELELQILNQTELEEIPEDNRYMVEFHTRVDQLFGTVNQEGKPFVYHYVSVLSYEISIVKSEVEIKKPESPVIQDAEVFVD